MIPHQILQEPPANLQASLRCIPLADLSELHYHQLIIIIILSYLDVGSRQYLNSPLQLLSEFPEHEKAEWKIFLFHLFIYSLLVRCACVDVCMLRHACEARANLQEFSPSRPLVSGGWSQGIRLDSKCLCPLRQCLCLG